MSQTAQKSSLIVGTQKTEIRTGDSKGVAVFLVKNVGKSIEILWAQFRKSAYNTRCTLIKVYSGLTQFFSWFGFWPLYNLLFKIEIRGCENLKNLKGPLIMISNHTRFYDSFLYRIIVGPFSSLLPMRFMAVLRFTDKFMSFVKKTGAIHFVYSLFGVFVVEVGLGLNKNLKRARDILKNNGVVAMFPEGDLIKTGEIAMFRRGVSALALSTHTKVLPMHINIKEGNLKRFKRGTIVVNIGKAHYLETGSTYEVLAEELRGEVVRLGSRNNI